MRRLNDLKQVHTYSERSFPFRVFHICPGQRQILHLHWHEELEIIVILKGGGDFSIGSETFTASRGDVLVINKGLLHTGYSDYWKNVEYNAIVFHPSFLGMSAIDSEFMNIIEPYTSGRTMFPTIIRPSSPDHERLMAILAQIVEENEGKRPGYELAIKSLLNVACIHLNRNAERNPRDAMRLRTNIENNENFKKLVSHIELHYSDRMTVHEAASIVKMSPYHFCRTFKRMTGSTFIDYLNYFRIDKAEQLLEHSDHSVTMVAQLVGFGSISYFSYIYKKYKGVPPSQCRIRSMQS